ncbi:MAG: hypothetical protein IKP88_21480 [Lachnospiraceae bacterium]|nr:hypothetical protein [Lachnospiraceae bacterium]
MLSIVQKERQNYLDASFTVEAVFVVPIIVFGIIGIILLVFYLHNQVRATADTDNLLFAAERVKTESKYDKFSLTYDFKDQLKSYFGGKIEEGIVECSPQKMKVSLKIRQNVPKDGLMGLITREISLIDKKEERSMPDREEITRIIKAASEIFDSLKDILKTGENKE